MHYLRLWNNTACYYVLSALFMLLNKGMYLHAQSYHKSWIYLTNQSVFGIHNITWWQRETKDAAGQEL